MNMLYEYGNVLDWLNVLFCGTTFIIWAAEYILQGLGIYRLAEAQGIDSPWMAFVPWARTYLHGKIAGEIPFGKKRMKHAGLWMVLIPAVLGGVIVAACFGMICMSFISLRIFGGVVMSVLFFLIFVILMLCAVVYAAVMGVLRGMVNYQIFRVFNQQHMAVLHTLLSMFVPMYQAIYFFMLRKRVHVRRESKGSVETQQTKQEESKSE